MKTVLLVPGFYEDINSRDYSSVIKGVSEKGYKVRFIKINWARTTIEQWAEELNNTYEKLDPKKTILAGFSFGAMTSLVSASKRVPAELWLFSPSPYFFEDIKSSQMKQSWLKPIGHRRVTAFKKISYKNCIKKIDCKILTFFGELEAGNWSIAINHRTKNSQLIKIPNVKHDVSDDKYIEAIKQNI